MKNLINSKEVDEGIKEYSVEQNPWDWEDHCGACDWFGNKKRCPHYNFVKNNPGIYWKDIGCKEFWD